MSEQSQQKHPKKRRLRRAVFWILVALLIAGATGWPQRKLFEVAVGKALNAEVEAVGVSLFGHVRAYEIRLYDNPGERQKRNAALSLSGFDLDYSLFRSGGSHVPRLHIDEIELNLEGADPANSNYGFLKTLLFGPKTDIDPTPYIPQSTTMGNVRWRCRLPEGGMVIDGLRLEAEFAALDAFSIHLDGDGLTGEWWHKSSPAPVTFEHGQVDARVVRTADRLLLENIRCVLPDAVSVDGAVTLVFLPAELEIDAAFPQFVLHGAPISGLISGLAGAPVAFDVLDFSGTTLCGKVMGETLAMPGSKVSLTATGVTLGEPGRELYRGDLRVTGSAVGQQGVAWELDAVLAQGQSLHAKIAGGLTRGSCAFAFDDWGRDALFGALPDDLDQHLQSAAGVQRLSTAIDLEWDKPSYRITGRLQPLLGLPGAMPRSADISFRGKGMIGAGPPLYDGTFTVQIDNESLRADVTVESWDNLRALVSLDTFETMFWIEAIGGITAVDNFRAALTGTVGAVLTGRPWTPSLDLDLAIDPLQYKGTALFAGKPLRVKGKVTLDEAWRRAAGDGLDIRVADAAAFTLSDWALSFVDYTGAAGVNGTVDLAFLGTLLGLPGLRGTAAVSAPVESARGIISAPFDLTADSFGYGGLILPAETKLTARGRAGYDLLTNTVTGADLSGELGPGTHIAAATWSLEPAALRFGFPFTVESDLKPLVDLGLLDAASGTARMIGAAAYSDDCLTASAKITVAADSVTLTDAVARMSGVTFNGDVRYDGSLHGGGEWRAAETIVAGTPLREGHCTVVFEGDGVQCKDYRAALFDGALAAEAQVGLLAQGFPIRLTATISNLNLETFTREYNPPSVKLTGLADGEALLVLDAGAIQDLQVNLRSPQGFSMNRDFVKRLLLSQYIKDVKGGKTLDKVVASVLGKAEQRPFDAAELTLRQVENQLAGQAILKSPKLNLTVDLHIDPDTLKEMLLLYQDAHLEKIDNVKAEPVQ